MNRFGKLYGHTIELTVTYARLIEQNVILCSEVTNDRIVELPRLVRYDGINTCKIAPLPRPQKFLEL